MNVKFAIQTLSKSVADSLTFVNKIKLEKSVAQKFVDTQPTAEFCLNFNNMGDILNCKNKFAKGDFNTPLTDETYESLKIHAEQFETYICSLRDEQEVPILQTGRKTGFLGMIVLLRNMFALYAKVKRLGMSYLLTYKLSQDFLETFFSAIRSRGGFNNNPNVVQLKSAYRRLLVRHELKEFETGNCLFDGVKVLHCSSATKKKHQKHQKGSNKVSILGMITSKLCQIYHLSWKIGFNKKAQDICRKSNTINELRILRPILQYYHSV
jgi:hypothetical protein